MGIFSDLAGAVTSGFASIESKIAAIAISVLIFIAIGAAGYFYIHDKNIALTKAKAALTLAQGQMAAAQAGNKADLAVITALRAQQSKSDAAQATMNTRDQTAQSAVANIQTLIDRDICMSVPTVKLTGRAKTPETVNADGPVAKVLSDALTALAAAQKKQETAQ